MVLRAKVQRVFAAAVARREHYKKLAETRCDCDFRSNNMQGPCRFCRGCSEFEAIIRRGRWMRSRNLRVYRKCAENFVVDARALLREYSE